jgi:glycosyltransferase involved in cell wall biosynthesis
VGSPEGVADTATLPRVSVVVPTYQRRHALPQFVEPLLADPALHELVVAVDGATDGTLEYLRERAEHDARVKVLDLPNRGVPPARQSGIEAATGDVVLLMDDDVIAEPGLVSGHARRHAAGGRRLVLGYMPNDWRALPRGRRGIARIYARAYAAACRRFASEPDHVLLGLWGGNLSMPREEFLRVGVKTEMSLPRGQDDREFGIRLFRAGIRGEFDPALRAEHRYDRPLDKFRSDCRIQGGTRKLIHDLHPDIVGPRLQAAHTDANAVDGVGQGLPRPLRRALPAFARDPLFGLATGALELLFRLGVRSGWLALETLTARGIGSLETQRGVLDHG